MSLATLQAALLGVRYLSLDTNIFVAAADRGDPRQPCAAWLTGAVERGQFECAISAINAAELFVGAFKKSWESGIATQTYLRRFPHLIVVPFTLDVASDAGHVRATTKLDLPDAIVLANAISVNCQAIVHADKEWVRRARPYATSITLIYLGDHCT